jgi:hypothetical protein
LSSKKRITSRKVEQQKANHQQKAEATKMLV